MWFWHQIPVHATHSSRGGGLKTAAAASSNTFFQEEQPIAASSAALIQMKILTTDYNLYLVQMQPPIRGFNINTSLTFHDQHAGRALNTEKFN